MEVLRLLTNLVLSPKSWPQHPLTNFDIELVEKLQQDIRSEAWSEIIQNSLGLFITLAFCAGFVYLFVKIARLEKKIDR